LETIKQREEGDATKIISLVKAIQKTAEENAGTPFLVALTDRARAVQESFEDRQTSTAEALTDLLHEIERNEQRQKQQAEKDLDALTFFVFVRLEESGVPNTEAVSKKVREAFANHSNWQTSEKELRELRQRVAFAIYARKMIWRKSRHW
jgi:type I restriction enzyme R subunit